MAVEERMRAKPVAWPSVGQSVLILSDGGMVLGQIELRGFTPDPAIVDRLGEEEALKLHCAEMARLIADAINFHADMHQEAPDA